jgi:hypothetical protein
MPVITREKGFAIAAAMRSRKTNPMRWALDHEHKVRTVIDMLYKGLGSKRSGPKTQAVFRDLMKDGYLPKEGS